MTQSDPFIADLMAPGAPFEVVQNGNIRAFAHAPKTLSEVLNRARNHGEAEFIVSGKRRLSYADFFDVADALSGYFQDDVHIKPGDRVAICMKNSPEWMTAFVAIIQTGAVAVLVNSRGTGDAMRRAVDDAGCAFMVADTKRLNAMREAGCDVPVLLSHEYPGGGRSFVPVPRAPGDLCAMFFTSGTTGTAKAAAITNMAMVTGVMNTQLAMAAVFTKMAKSYGIDVATLRAQMPQSCSLLVFPLFHTSGCSAVFLTAVTMGAKLVLMDRWDGTEALRLIAAERITTFGGVPTMHWDLLKAMRDQSAKGEGLDASSLMSISCGGQALPLGLLSEIRETFPKAFIGAGYGMTETCGAVSQANGEAYLACPEASGQILPMVDVRIVGDDESVLPVGGVGEIHVRGATLMQGYYGRPEETRAAFDDGWFKTGDIGKLDENGYIYIIDRKTDMVISGGENIYCAEIEQVLGKQPGVRAVTAFGVSDERLGERLVVGIVPTDTGLSSTDVAAFAEAHLGDYQRPTDIWVNPEGFPLNAMGKIEKQKVRRLYLERNRA